MARIELVKVNKNIETSTNILGNTIGRMLFSSGRTESGGDYPGERTSSFSLNDIDLTIPDGKTMVILGPSGCGKTTLLKVIAGLLPPDSGQVLYDGIDIAEIPPRERGIGMVFQNYALFPHFTSGENILSFFMFRKKTPELDQEAQEKYQRTSELMGVDIEHLIGRMPGNLSGGEKQRVAVARCITRDPTLFLLDEPFSNLDQKLREKYRISLKKLLRHFNITTVYVTHDQHEAVILADILCIMDRGELVQVGTYQEIYQSPKNIFTAEFLNLEYESRAFNQCDGEEFGLTYRGKVVGFRPEDATVCEKGAGMARGRVIDVIDLPMKKKSVLTVQLKKCDIQMYATKEYREGDEIEIKLERNDVFDPDSGDRISSH